MLKQRFLTGLVPRHEIRRVGPGDHGHRTRAELEQAVTDENVELMRTHHPSLKHAFDVWILTEPTGKRVWSLEGLSEAPSHTHAGGLEIHTVTTAWAHNSFNFPRDGPDTIRWPINTRRLLSGNDLARFAAMFPNAVGVQVLIAGQVNVLYAEPSSIEKDYASGVPQEVGRLKVGFSVLDMAPSRPQHCSGCGVSEKMGSRNPTACLGLGLELSSGERVLTTATHGFVDLPGPGYFGRAASFLRSIKKSL